MDSTKSATSMISAMGLATLIGISVIYKPAIDSIIFVQLASNQIVWLWQTYSARPSRSWEAILSCRLRTDSAVALDTILLLF